MTYKVFIDGQEGTTGLKIQERLAERRDLVVLAIDPDRRKDREARRELLNAADIAVLCLPDLAAREAVSLVENRHTCVLDASTAHRTAPDWAYGLPELSPEHRSRLLQAKRIAIPGCHATGFALAVYPLVKSGLLPRDYPVTCHSLSGYSGGGKKLIADYEVDRREDPSLKAPRHYALGLDHKHLPEMKEIVGLAQPPLFLPVVSNYYQGMVVSVPLLPRLLPTRPTVAGVHEGLTQYYAGQRFIRVMPLDRNLTLDGGLLDTTGCNGTNRADLFVFGNADQILISVRLDNLGKGASGAAVQCMNLVLGAPEDQGLVG